ncbi:MAG: TIGR00153 family protein [gamma proteobacterium symbiont of Bathyaustriella thionipta]|nr:TIGR00153 family protein [gamma proteobacterium symbiont of Bathyaustriella thionipta]MCU7950436.1 TIGR00153 family protein [gamma proteobacterium symbiont of Bathyaustriella thionipta]MCU7954846.1 TIGR00153 family protein [gamma proteobacterium symbiont of Bathyaustriella thionipta]MCU7956951.1 TIGR00153 family protein [gamma proteobacterium symbiont of Bathyaustriella thionipta]MCU7967429.1 TIGR00153 family protein [gamma proteobacterium symbiont of Bathyaustriella thionipta]
MRKKPTIATMFGKSPFKALQTHMGIVKECVLEVPSLFDALIAGDKQTLTTQQEKIFSKEEEADILVDELRIHLPRSLFMAVDRRDLLDLLKLQDNIADTAQDIAGLMMERDMSVPQDMVEPLKALVQRCVDTCMHAATIVERIDELIETGFRGREATDVETMVEELSNIEDETDQMGRDLVQLLFSIEDNMNPVSVMFWYQMIQWVGNLGDHAEDVGNQMRLLIAK